MFGLSASFMGSAFLFFFLFCNCALGWRTKEWYLLEAVSCTGNMYLHFSYYLPAYFFSPTLYHHLKLLYDILKPGIRALELIVTESVSCSLAVSAIEWELVVRLLIYSCSTGNGGDERPTIPFHFFDYNVQAF